jgi:uncharacterized protein related to proFAR isomerase
LEVVPVIDILDGLAVHAVKGVRKNYKPIKSVLTASADPVKVATAFKGLGFKELYVADLNAITGNHDNFSVIKQIVDETKKSETINTARTIKNNRRNRNTKLHKLHQRSN